MPRARHFINIIIALLEQFYTEITLRLSSTIFHFSLTMYLYSFMCVCVCVCVCVCLCVCCCCFGCGEKGKEEEEEADDTSGSRGICWSCLRLYDYDFILMGAAARIGLGLVKNGVRKAAGVTRTRISRFQIILALLQAITWCAGRVFCLQDFPALLWNFCCKKEQQWEHNTILLLIYCMKNIIIKIKTSNINTK